MPTDEAVIKLRRELEKAVEAAQRNGLQDGHIHAELERQGSHIAELMFTKSTRRPL